MKGDIREHFISQGQMRDYCDELHDRCRPSISSSSSSPFWPPGRAVRNLLGNAARHATSSIALAQRTDGAFAKLTVADDGPGIPEGQRDTALERFTRLDEARARDTGGVGLGLAIVSNVVTGHRGRLEITDNGPGTLITIWLPRDKS